MQKVYDSTSLMDFRILGPLEVWDRERLVLITAAKQRAVLAALLLRANQVLPTESVIDQVWGSEPPSTARVTVQNYIRRLRLLLTPSPAGLHASDHGIITRPPGYLLRVPEDGLDLLRFERIVAEARALLDQDARSAANRLRDGLALWRGPALSDVDSEPLRQTEAPRLEELWLAAQEDLIEAELRSGRHAETIGALRTLVTQYPLRERLWGQLMLALYRCDRQAEALVCYQDGRRILIEQAGVEPGAALQRLQHAILAGDASLTPPSPQPSIVVSTESRPGAPTNSHAEGHCLPPHDSEAVVATGNLPAEMTSFVGRSREVAEVERLLSVSRVVTLTGVAGVGKTRLALRVAAKVQPAFDGCVWQVDLGTLRHPEAVVHAVASALGVPEHAGRSGVDVLSEHLADRRLLLVLDNCEHMVDACADLTKTLLRAAPGLWVLATSRQPLDVPGEHTLVVPPLSVPDPQRPLAACDVIRDEAVVLFAERASAAVPGFTITPQNQAAVARLCHRLDGIPLAIEFAAVRLGCLSVDQITERLADRYRLLRARGRTAPPRHQTLRAAVAWSYELCSPAEQLAWARASIFAGAFDLEAAENVCSGDGLDQEAILEVVAGLVDRSILLREEEAGMVRYRLLETLRDYGAERLAELGQTETLRQRHRDWYLHIAEQAEVTPCADQIDRFVRLQREHLNLRAALDCSLTASGQARDGLRIASTLWTLWIPRGLLSEGRSWLDRALTLDQRPSTDRAKALWVNAALTVLQGDLAAAAPLLEQGFAVARQLGDASALAYLTQVAGVAALSAGDPPCARVLLQEAAARHRDAGDLDSMSIMNLAHLGLTYCMLGDPDRAIALCEEARKLSKVHAERWALSDTLWVLGLALWLHGDTPSAIAETRQCLRVKHAFNDRLGSATAVELLAWFTGREDRPERAARLLGAAQTMWRALGRPPLLTSTRFAALHRECTARTRQKLGEGSYTAALSKGAQLDLDQVIRYALDEQAQQAPALKAPLGRVHPAAVLRRRSGLRASGAVAGWERERTRGRRPVCRA